MSKIYSEIFEWSPGISGQPVFYNFFFGFHIQLFTNYICEVLNLNFPQYTFKFREGKISLEIFCLSRRRWVPLTPEEWVRQHAIAFLHDHGGFPIALISAEYVWSSMGGRGRSDIVVFNNNAKVLGL